MDDTDVLFERFEKSRKLNEYARYTEEVLIPELYKLAVPWRYFKWRKLYKEIKRRNQYVKNELAKMGR